MHQRTDKVLLGCAVAGFLIMSLSFLLMELEDLPILPGILFWAGSVSGGLLMGILEGRRRAFFRKSQIDRKKVQRPRPGVLNFGSSVLAKAFDWAQVISFVTMGIVWYATHGIGIENYILLSITVFSFSMHCVLNGRIFFYVTNQQINQHMLDNDIKRKKGKERKERYENECIGKTSHVIAAECCDDLRHVSQSGRRR